MSASNSRDPRFDSASARPRRRWLWVLLIVFGLFVFGTGSCVGLVAYGVSRVKGSSGVVKPNTTLVARFSGAVQDDGGKLGFESLMAGEGASDVLGFCRGLMRAREDERVEGLFLTVDSLQASVGTVESVRECIEDFRRSGKPVRVLLESDTAGDVELYLASAGTEIVLSPHTLVNFDGFYGEVLFFRRILERVGVKAQFLQFKEYKSAAEPFIRDSMSKPMREAYESLLGNVWRHLVDGVARDRGVEVATLEKLSEKGFMSATDVLDARLVDRLGYRDQIMAEMGDYFMKVSKYLGDDDDLVLDPEAKKIALISASGPVIVHGDSPWSGGQNLDGRNVARQIRQAAEDESVDAILFRVDSPGGSMVGSDLVWREVVMAKEKHGKPVVVSMGGVAASGGYWVSMAADAIVAEPSTITGSIGVVYGKFSYQKLLELLQVDRDTVQIGKNSNLWSATEEMTPEQIELIRALMQQGYDAFVQKVAQGRGRSVDEIKEVAKGRVWTGEQAKARALVDELGGLHKAMQVCREKMGAGAEAKLQLVPYPKGGTFAQIMRELGWSDDKGEVLSRLGAMSWKRLWGAGPGREWEQVMQAAQRDTQAGVWALAPQIRFR